MRRFRLLVNNTAGVLGTSHDQLSSLCEALRAGDVEPDVEMVESLDSVTARARTAVEAGYAAVVVVGGDGTVERAAAAMIGSQIPLGIVPAGTFNNLSRALAIPSTLQDAAHVLVSGQPRAIDAGMVNGVPFFEAAGIGLDAALFPLGEEIKEGRLAHVVAALSTLIRSRPRRLNVRLSGPDGERVFRVAAQMVVIANAPYYGMGFAVAPSAKLDDGLLTVATFERFSKLELIRHFLTIAFGRFVYDPRITLQVASGVTFSGARSIAVHADGNRISRLPARCEVIPRAVNVLVPGT